MIGLKSFVFEKSLLLKSVARVMKTKKENCMMKVLDLVLGG